MAVARFTRKMAPSTRRWSSPGRRREGARGPTLPKLTQPRVAAGEKVIKLLSLSTRMVRDSISVLTLCKIAHIVYSLLILSNKVLRIYQFITKYKTHGIAISLLQLSNSRKTIVASLLKHVIVFLNFSKRYVRLLYVRKVLLIETGTTM